MNMEIMRDHITADHPRYTQLRGAFNLLYAGIHGQKSLINATLPEHEEKKRVFYRQNRFASFEIYLPGRTL